MESRQAVIQSATGSYVVETPIFFKSLHGETPVLRGSHGGLPYFLISGPENSLLGKYVQTLVRYHDQEDFVSLRRRIAETLPSGYSVGKIVEVDLGEALDEIIGSKAAGLL